MWMWQSVIKFVVSCQQRIQNALPTPTQRRQLFSVVSQRT
jgi:hypothetical protein